MVNKLKDSSQILNVLPIGILILDSNGKIEYSNKQAINFYGGNEKDVLNQYLTIPADNENWQEVVLNTSNKEMQTVAEIKSSKINWKGKDSFLVCLKDVSGKRDDQEIIETVFQAFSVLQDGFFICNELGEIIYANAAFEKITGYNRKEIYGKSPSFLKSGVQNDEFYDDFYKKLSVDGEWSGIIWNKRANGEVYPERLNITSIFKEQGSVKYYVAIFTDVTDYINSAEALKKTHKEAIESERKKTEFLSRASQDVRVPMSGILGYSDMLAETILTTEQQEYLEVIRSSSRSLINIINEILDISNLDSGIKGSYISAFSVRDLIQELYRFFKVHTVKKPIVLGHYFSGNIPEWIDGEKEPLRQVLTNLLSNAFKFTSSGKISFGVDSVEDLGDLMKFHFSVSDTGKGIDEKNLQKIFDPFYQEDNVRNDPSVGSGSGLGLVIVKSLIEKNGGSIHVESSFGKGSKFSFSFILKKTDRKGSAAKLLKDLEVRMEKWKNRGRSLSIVLADVSYPNQMYLKRILERKNIFVTVASNGKQVIECLLDKDYDAILMDIRMPIMDGLEASKIIRQMKDSKKSQVPIIAMSGTTSKEELEICKEAGMNSLLLKPIESEMLIYEILKYVFP